MMTLVLRSLLLTLVLALASAGPFVDRGSSGNSDASITFENSHRPGSGSGSSAQHGETSATSVQTFSGEGQQTNQGQATAVSTQEQSGLFGAIQTMSNAAFIEALQGTGEDDSAGSGSSQQASDNQVNIKSTQLQQNVQGTLVNVQSGNKGIVFVNTDEAGAVVNSQSQSQNQDQDQQNTLLNIKDGNEIVLIITANETEAEELPPVASSPCRIFCLRPHSNTPYCCDDGTNHNGEQAIHGGQCPEVRFLCIRYVFFRKCGHDGQCADSDKCCYDTCVQHHICKSADPTE